MPIKYHADLIQGSEEWHAARCGLLTASEMHLIISPTLKPSSNEKERTHLFELLAQRITGYVEPGYISDSMLRGHQDEIDARELYKRYYAPVKEVGFITNDKWGFTIGYSPDALVDEDGAIECKSRAQKHQLRTLTEYVPANKIDPDFMIQVQTGLLVSERKWCDLISYCGGLPMATVRVYPDEAIQTAIIAAAKGFEERLAAALAKYEAVTASDARLIETERRIEVEMYT